MTQPSSVQTAALRALRIGHPDPAGLLAAPCGRDRQRIIEELTRREFGDSDQA
jgi:hypothetical protein